MQGAAWYLKIDGAITGSINALIGLIAGTIFGFTVAKKELEKKE